MRRLAAITINFVLLLSAVVPANARKIEFFEFSGPRPIKRQIRWPSSKITVAFSTSLTTPGPNFKIGTDVVGAARRALSRWAGVTGITFVATSATAQSISSVVGDGVSLITIADTRENNSIFTSAAMTGRTRVFYDPDTGIISEADICINPHPALNDGTPVQFSTDGSPGTYDLESTFTHEIGHLLGLDHSAVIASTMQARQGLNGVYGLPAFSGRTLSETDREQVLGLYGSDDGRGTISGKVVGTNTGAHIWTESIETGRVIAETAVAEDGNYSMAAIPPGQYRVLIEQQGSEIPGPQRVSATSIQPAEPEGLFRANELAGKLVVTADSTSPLNSTVITQGGQFLRPVLLGMNGELSNVALPLEAGKTFRVHIAGEGIDQLSGSAISITSPFFKVDSASVVHEQFATSLPVISFDLTVAANAPFGDYSIKLESRSGEVAFISGGITLDPGVDSIAPNPLDDSRFFVRQHYRDFLGREPDGEGLEYWVNQLQQCGSDAACNRARRLEISAAFFAEGEFQETGAFVYGLYRTIGRRPTFEEFSDDRSSIADTGDDLQTRKRNLALDFVSRPEFLKKYPESASGEKFVDALLAETLQTSDRAALLALYDGSKNSRATIVSRLISSPGFLRAEYNRIYVLMQYFSYLRRDADETGFNSWVNLLAGNPRGTGSFGRVACAFLNSAEYQARFGMAITHSNAECR